jgi:hypothetical protein
VASLSRSLRRRRCGGWRYGRPRRLANGHDATVIRRRQAAAMAGGDDTEHHDHGDDCGCPHRGAARRRGSIGLRPGDSAWIASEAGIGHVFRSLVGRAVPDNAAHRSGFQPAQLRAPKPCDRPTPCPEGSHSRRVGIDTRRPEDPRRHSRFRGPVFGS